MKALKIASYIIFVAADLFVFKNLFGQDEVQSAIGVIALIQALMFVVFSYNELKSLG